MQTAHTLLLTGCMAFFIAGCTPPEKTTTTSPRPVKVAVVDSPLTANSGVFPGVAEATQEADLSFRVSGPLTGLPAIKGQGVTQGELLAQIDRRDYEVQVRNVEALLENAQASLLQMKKQYQRSIKIQSTSHGIISQADIDKDKAAMDVASAQVKAFAAQLEASKDALRYTSLLAPFSGEVVERFVDNFEDVNQKQPVLRLLDISKIEMTVDLPAKWAKSASSFAGLKVSFSAYPDISLPATVKEMGREASKTTNTYPLTVIMSQPDGIRIFPGMVGQLRLSVNSTPQEKTNIVIPDTAIFSSGGSISSVWVVDEHSQQVMKKTIEIASITPDGVVVKSGVAPGQRIVVAGVHSLNEGQQVSVVGVEES